MIHKISGLWFFICMVINIIASSEPESSRFILSGIIGTFLGVVWLMSIGHSPRSI